MNQIWKSLLIAKNQSIAFFAAGIAALTGASWTVFTHVRPSSHGPDTFQVSTAQVAGTVTVQGNLVLGMTSEMVQAQIKQQVDEAIRDERAQRKLLENELARLRSEQTKTSRDTEQLSNELQRISAKSSQKTGAATVQDKREIMELTVRIYGPESQKSVLAMNDLATVLFETGAYGESITIIKAALSVQEKNLGPSDLLTGNLLSNYAAVLLASGRLTEAERVLIRSLDIFRTSLGSNHPTVAAAFNSLGLLYSLSGRRDEAIAALTNAYIIFDSVGATKAAQTVQSNLEALRKEKLG